MRTIVTSIILAAFFLIGSSGAALAARGVDCRVTGVQDQIVTLDCGKKADKLDVGAKVKVKTARKKAIEGC